MGRQLGEAADDDLSDFVPPGPQKKAKVKEDASAAAASDGQGTGGSGRSTAAAPPSDLERGGSLGAAAPSNLSAVAQLSRSMRNLSDSLGSLAGSVGRIDVVARSYDLCGATRERAGPGQDARKGRAGARREKG